MDGKSLFEGTINFAERALQLRSRRHELILSNIANADTPNYKAFDMMVDEALTRQLPKEGEMDLEKTNPAHFPKGGPIDMNVRPRKLNLSTQVTLRGDGNTVDMEREMSNLAANQLQYKISAQIIGRKFQSLKNIIQGGKS